ncbi:MAG: aminoglycoside phosphotransferase family protein [Defluviitaleaceae bacterium]|nr:aminoglycoside phosphotransferase family protein [Defluviitaleaceae bacterium]
MNLKNIITTRSNKTIYRDGDRCIKLFQKGFSKADVLNEALNHARIEETALNIPKLLEVTMIEGCWAIVSEYIEGRTLSEIMIADPANRQEYINLLVDIQLEIHAQRSPLLTNHRDKMLRKISMTTYDNAIKYELQTHLESMPRHDKVCHGDFRPSNVIISPEGKRYIIDWSHATKGNASADAARTYLIYLLTGREEEGEAYLKAFCKKSGTQRHYVEKWLRIVAASQSVKGVEAESLFLDRIVNVVDYW